MSRIALTIDRLVLKGFDPGDGKALRAGLERELSRLLSEPAMRAAWTGSRRTPVVRLNMSLEPGPAGSRKFGGALARSVVKRLQP